MRNESVINKLPSASYQEGIPAYLLDEQGIVLFEFLYNPETQDVSRRINYAEPQVALASVQPSQYISSTGRVKRLSNLLMESWGDRKSLRPLLEQIQSLAVADVASGKYSPPIVYFSWGTESFGPAVLSDEISWTEDLWVGGEPASVRLNLTLKEIPATSTEQSAPTAPATTTQPQTSTEENQTQAAINQLVGGLGQIVQDAAIVLTTRQQQEGTKKATSYLRSNINQASSIVRQAFRQNSFSVQTGSDGNVSFTESRSNRTFPLGNYDGIEFKPLF